MTNRMLWLLSYVGLGLALVMGNRPLKQQDQKRNQNHEKMMELVDNVDSVDGNALHLRSYQHAVSLRNNIYLDNDQSENSPRSLTSDFNNNNNINNNNINERIGKASSSKNTFDSLLDNLQSTVVNIMHQNSDARRNSVPLSYDEKPPFWQPESWERRAREPKVYDYVEGPFVKNRLAWDNSRVGSRSVDAKSSFNESEDLPDEPKNFPKRDQDRGDETSSMDLEEEKSRRNRNSEFKERNLASSRGSREVSKRHTQQSQVMLREVRGNRQYDVPQIECPASEDGMERFACPTPDRMGRYRCIDDHVLCDGFIDCPTGEDEDRQACMFYKTIKAHLDVLADAVLRWARGR